MCRRKRVGFCIAIVAGPCSIGDRDPVGPRSFDARSPVFGRSLRRRADECSSQLFDVGLGPNQCFDDRRCGGFVGDALAADHPSVFGRAKLEYVREPVAGVAGDEAVDDRSVNRCGLGLGHPRSAASGLAPASVVFRCLGQSRSGMPSSGNGSDSGTRSVSRVLISWSMSAGWATLGCRLPAADRMSSTMIVRLMSRSPDLFW